MRLLFTTVFALAPFMAAAADAPEQVLEKHGLKNTGGLWYSAGDLQIADRMPTIERLERRLLELRKQMEQLLDQNELMKTQLAGFIANQRRLRDARNSVKGGSPEQKRLDEQIKQQNSAIEQLKKSIVSAENLGGTMPLKGLVTDLVGLRSELAFHVLTARRLIEQSPAMYEKQRKNSEVTAALSALEPPGQLAAPRGYANDLRSLARVEKLLFTDELPFYREGRQIRVTGIANEELPISLAFFDTGEPTVITHTMAESLGIELDGKPKRRLRLEGKYDVRAARAQLASLRFGRHVLRDVEVFVLPPENENLGGRVGRAAFQGLRVRIVPERLVLRIEQSADKGDK